MHCLRQTAAWTSTSSAPKWCRTTASPTCGTSRRCTAATSPRWSRPTTPRDPWWSTCAYRNWRPEVSQRDWHCVCVCVWVSRYIILTKKKKKSVFFIRQERTPTRWEFVCEMCVFLFFQWCKGVENYSHVRERERHFVSPRRDAIGILLTKIRHLSENDPWDPRRH